MRLITSAAYVGQELSAEFGEIPPAFLPVGVARLYEAQIARFGPGRPIFLTIPETFTPQPHDQRRLAELGVVLLSVPGGLRLGESVVYAMNSIDMPPGAIEILHGDTLIDDLPAAAPGDVIAIHDEGDDYSWAAVDVEADRVTGLEVLAMGSGRDDPRSVACGYFGFSSSSALVRAITRARGDLICGINLYARERPMRAAPARQWHDFGHIQVKNNLRFVDHYEWLRSIRHRLFGCHLHDTEWPATDHRVPFAGGIEYDRLIPLLPPNCLFVWELSPRMKAEDIRAALARWKARFACGDGV